VNIIERVKEILIAPKQAWPVIASEETDTVSLYTQYIMILAAIQAVAGFIGMSLFGVSFMGVSVRVPIMTGLLQMILGYAMSLAVVYVVSMIANALAPSFGGQKNSMSALKLVAYSSTAAMLGGIFAIIPALGILTLVAALYSLYLLFLGVPTLMQVPRGKALTYTAVLVVCAIVVGAVFGMLLGSFQGGIQGGSAVMMDTHAPTGQVSMTPQGTVGTVSVDTAKMEAWAKRMEDAGKKLERAQQSGDQAAMEAAIKEMSALQGEQPFSR
jgi:Yip1 domain